MQNEYRQMWEKILESHMVRVDNRADYIPDTKTNIAAFGLVVGTSPEQLDTDEIGRQRKIVGAEQFMRHAAKIRGLVRKVKKAKTQTITKSDDSESVNYKSSQKFPSYGGRFKDRFFDAN